MICITAEPKKAGILILLLSNYVQYIIKKGILAKHNSYKKYNSQYFSDIGTNKSEKQNKNILKNTEGFLVLARRIIPSTCLPCITKTPWT